MTTPPPGTVAYQVEKSDRYARLSRLKLRQAQGELERGDTMPASEKAYGAVGCAVKACAELRGWNHYSHLRVGRIIEHLTDEWREPELSRHYLALYGLHSNFFEHCLSAALVQEGLETAKILTARLEEIRQSEPRPLPRTSLNQEQRRRLALLMQPPKEEQVALEELPTLEDLPE